MNRREFVGASAAGASAAAAQSKSSTGPAADYKPGKAVMVVGCQTPPTTDDRLNYFKRHGVDYCCGYPESMPGGSFEVDALSRMLDMGKKHGVNITMIQFPLPSSYIAKSPMPSIMMGKPDRDRDIEKCCQIIRNAAKAGVPSIKYNLTILGVLSGEPTLGRGGIIQRSWDFAKAKQDPPLTEAGPAPAPVMWERIEYFVKRVVPVATEYKIRLACHPHDPGVPPSGFRGVDRVLGTVDGLKKFISIVDSPYHGLNFCQGTVSEMLQDPAKELPDVIRYFGQRKKIFNVHFRNIKGKRDKFVETYPDEGDINFFKIIQVYKEVGYPYMLMPDHMPRHTNDAGGKEAFAWAYGYIKALIQAAQTAA
ncbi:MAG: mannonate dehydratase [Bryobacterales bacterium]|nr:mannonate dehydratase [Bryobacterales bacterium]